MFRKLSLKYFSLDQRRNGHSPSLFELQEGSTGKLGKDRRENRQMVENSIVIEEEDAIATAHGSVY